MTTTPEQERAPELPQTISGDGREIWGWVGKLSAYVQRQDKMRELGQRIRELGTRCGDCSLWMTRDCPRETHSNATGRSRGPSMNGLKCVKFVEKSIVTEFRAELTEELKKVENNGQ